MSKWEVELYISSHCKIDKKIEFKSQKGDFYPFDSQINISNYHNGLQIQIEALAETEEDAIDAGFYFIGQALNYIAYKKKSPFDLHKHLTQSQLQRKNARQILTKDDWEEAFSRGRSIQVNKAKLAMSLSWFRKSLNSRDPIDSFLSRWLVLETICKGINLEGKIKEEQSKVSNREIKRQSNQCFEKLKKIKWTSEFKKANLYYQWKEITQKCHKDKGSIYYQIKQKLFTENIEMDMFRLYQIKQRRNDIAHGKFAINDIDTIKEIIKMNEDIEDVAHKLLEKEVKNIPHSSYFSE